MAKNSDQRAGGFETENTGGVLSGLLADEEHFDRRAMFRLGTWGMASVGAVIVAVLANQTGLKLRHDEAAALDLARQSQQIQSVAKESQNETRRLASAIDTLNGDRDRMYSRLTTLEQGLGSVTGAIAKQSATAATPPAVSPPASAGQPVAQTTAPETAPAVAPVAASVTTSVSPATATATPAPEKTTIEQPRAEAKRPAPPATVIAAAAPPAPAPPNPPATTSAEPLMASKSFMAPPDAAAAKLVEPEPATRTAAATPPPAPAAPGPMIGPPAPAPSQAASAASEAAASTPATGKHAAAEPAPSALPPLAVKHTEFGVDVGGANSVGGLRALWRGLLKSRSNAPLAALQPIIVVKERDNGLGMQLRLVAGPLGDAAAAAKICASIAERGRPCETTVFDGQRLAMKADDAPATTSTIAAESSSEKSSLEKSSDPASEKSASDKSSAKPGFARQGSHRRGYSYLRRAPVEQAPQPPPQQPSTLSWFRRSQ